MDFLHEMTCEVICVPCECACIGVLTCWHTPQPRSKFPKPWQTLTSLRASNLLGSLLGLVFEGFRAARLGFGEEGLGFSMYACQPLTAVLEFLLEMDPKLDTVKPSVRPSPPPPGWYPLHTLFSASVASLVMPPTTKKPILPEP